MEIRGDVTGVGYRAWMKRQAASLQIVGWVRNKEKGKVEALVQGEKNNVDEIISRCKKGPDVAWVDKVIIVLNHESHLYSDFRILL